MLDDQFAQYKDSPSATPPPTVDPFAQYKQGVVSGSSTPPAPTGNFIQRTVDNLSTVTPADREGHSPVTNALQDFGAHIIGSTAGALVHPIQTIRSLAPDKGAAGVAESALGPLAAPALHAGKAIANEFRNNPLSVAIPSTLGDIVGSVGAGEMIPRGLPSLTTPLEASADAVTKAVKPSGIEAPEFSNNVERHFPDLVDYAKRTDNPLSVSKDFVKAANGAGKEANSFYKNNVLGPNANQIEPVSPNYGGVIHDPTNPGTATLADINQRITDNNAHLKLLEKSTSSDTAAAERISGLKAENGELLNTLHNALSKYTGIDPDVIQALRQRGPALGDIGDAINRADYSRLVSPGMDTIHGSRLGLATQALNYIRSFGKGPQVIADRALRTATGKFPQLSTPLPTVNPPSFTAIPTSEFTHQLGLDQMAQDAAAQRSQIANAARVRNANAALQAEMNARQASVNSGAALRAKGYRNSLTPLEPPK